ncbi:hypothetical protein D3C80_1279270 [compost metagenome]
MGELYDRNTIPFTAIFGLCRFDSRRYNYGDDGKPFYLEQRLLVISTDPGFVFFFSDWYTKLDWG